MKLLSDECLTPQLVPRARTAGYLESTCVRDRGMSGWPDWKLLRWAVDDGWVPVTHNARDFRGEAGHGGLLVAQPRHAGLICLSSWRPLGLALQFELFELALDEIPTLGSLDGHVLEITEIDAEQIRVDLYPLPRGTAP